MRDPLAGLDRSATTSSSASIPMAARSTRWKSSTRNASPRPSSNTGTCRRSRSTPARAEEFVNLYSKWRGINRLPALVMVFDLLARAARGHPPPRRLRPRRRGCVSSSHPARRSATQSLKELMRKTHDPEYVRALAWSRRRQRRRGRHGARRAAFPVRTRKPGDAAVESRHDRASPRRRGRRWRVSGTSTTSPATCS